MSPLDIVFAVLLLAAAVRCAYRGFIAEVMSMAALILGIVSAVLFSRAGAAVVDEYVGFSRWNQVIAFLVIFLLVYLTVKLVEGILHRLFEHVRLERLDRALGFFLGIAEGLVVIVFIVYVLHVQPLFDLSAALQRSYVARLVLDLVPMSQPFAAPGASHV